MTAGTERIVKGVTRREYERKRWHTLSDDKKKASIEKINRWAKEQS